MPLSSAVSYLSFSHICNLVLFFSFSLSFCFSFSKTIQINIIDDEEYEKNKNFFLDIGEPQLVEMSERKGGKFISQSTSLNRLRCAAIFWAQLTVLQSKKPAEKWAAGVSFRVVDHNPPAYVVLPYVTNNIFPLSTKEVKNVGPIIITSWGWNW